jgi:2',3'-cyclic-nucleotide 2'-phosphodiesterase (5'-nucleotidase family)
MGGFARRTSYWTAFEKKFPARPMIRLDAGSVFAVGVAGSALINRWMLEGTYRSKLDALNLTYWDILAWQELSDLAAAGQMSRQPFDVPLVSANLAPKTPAFPMVQRFVVREPVVDPRSGRKLRVGITGVLYDPEERISRRDFEVRNPEQAVREVLAEMQPKTDYRVLMIDAGVGKAVSLAILNPAVNLIVVAHDYEELVDPQQVGDTLICMPANEGRLLTEVRIALQQASQSIGIQTRFVPLDATVPDDPGMGELMRKAQADVEAFRRER